MKRLKNCVACSTLLIVLACDGETAETGSDPTVGGAEECGSEVRGTIEADTRWICDHALSGIVTVKNGATLTIDPGVTITGASGSALVIGRGSQLIAEGTADQPIVLTSALAAGTRARGDWGGLVLLGDAPNNLQTGTGAAEGLDANDPSYQYGGDNPTSSCGSLKYLRVEFAGFELTKDNELNGITFYSCGSGTRVDYVQSHMGKDDGIETFGGTWSGTHIVITGALDDSFDADQGYVGNLQYVYIQQDTATGNYGFEWSDQKDNLDALPRTHPVVSNVTFIGTGTNDGGFVETKSSAVKLKEGTAGEIHNAVLSYSYNAAIELTEEATEKVADAGGISITDTILFMNARKDDGVSLYAGSEGSPWDLAAFIEAAGNNIQLDVDPMIGSIRWGMGDLVPATGSPVLGAGRPVAGHEAADFIGAVKDSASDWTKGWTNYALN